MPLPPLRNAQTYVLGCVLLALAALALAVGLTLRYEYRSEVEGILAGSDRTAHKLASRTSEVIDSVNQTTLVIRYLHERNELPRLVALREAGVISDDLVQFVYLADRRGFVLDSTAGMSAANVADEDFFKRHRREADLDVDIAPVWTDPIRGVPGLPVTRRLGSVENFQGLITATVNPAALSVGYSQSEARGTAIGVLGSDGVYRSRSVDGRARHGERADLALVTQRAAEMRASFEPVVSTVDGRLRFLSVVKVDKYPLHAVVAVDADQALMGWQRTRQRVLLWAAAIALLTVISGAVVLLQARRLDHSRLRAQAAEKAFRATLEGSLDAYTLLRAERDADGRLQDLRITDCNTLAAALIGRTREAVLRCRLCDVAPTMAAFLPAFEQVMRTQRASQSQVQATEAGLSGRWLHHQLIPLADGVALITRDVTDRHTADEALAAQAHTDGLTGLANRRHFEELLEAARARTLRHGEPLALFYIDLDGFKQINDTLGHAAGDAVLIEVGRRLTAALRETDVVARLGGDEFAVLAERAGTLRDVHDLCERLLTALRAPHRLPAAEALATPSIGAAIFDGSETAAAHCERADAAMYAAKLAGKSRFVVAPLAGMASARAGH